MKRQQERLASEKRRLFKGRWMSLLLVICVMVTLILPAQAMGVTANATPSNATVYINGTKVSFEAYTINGSNYFKLRDLAMALNSTNKKIGIGYNGSTNTVEIKAGQPYVPVGGELELGDGLAKRATPGKATIHWVEEPSNANTMQLEYNIALGTYVINGNNFVKLRDLMQWVDVGVGYDSKTASIAIHTGQKYVLPKYTGNPLKSGEAIDNKYRKYYGAQPGSIHNHGEMVYHDGWYYHYGFRIKEGGQAIGYQSSYGDYIPDNWQVYGGKIFFEGALSSGVTTQVIFTMNLDGSGVKKIITNALDTGQRITVYKGKIYANTHTANGAGASIVSFNLDGSGRKVLYTGDLSVEPVPVGYGSRGYHIFNDRIYFMTKDKDIWYPTEKSVYSMKLDGSDQKLVTTLHNSPWNIVSVYDGYIYYETRWEGLHRMKIDGSDDVCVLPESMEQYAIYGDKIVYNVDHTMLGVVNTDGTGRYQFPNAKQDPNRTTPAYVSNLMVINSKYTFAQNVLLNNDSAANGYVRFSANYSDPNDDDIRGLRGWFPSKVPYINTLTDIGSSGGNSAALSDGWYNLRCMYNYMYIDKNGGAQLRTSDTNQKFYVENKNGIYFTLKTEDGKYLGIGATVVNGVQVKAVNQEYLWALRNEKGSDIFSMRPADNSNMLLNAAGEKSTDGTWIVLWKHDSEDAPNHAEFRFIPAK